MQIERATGGQITCETLRADLDWIRVNGRVFYRERTEDTQRPEQKRAA